MRTIRKQYNEPYIDRMRKTHEIIKSYQEDYLRKKRDKENKKPNCNKCKYDKGKDKCNPDNIYCLLHDCYLSNKGCKDKDVIL
jgi:hypothetical protein